MYANYMANFNQDKNISAKFQVNRMIFGADIARQTNRNTEPKNFSILNSRLHKSFGNNVNSCFKKILKKLSEIKRLSDRVKTIFTRKVILLCICLQHKI